jgi:hypothetical protein
MTRMGKGMLYLGHLAGDSNGCGVWVFAQLSLPHSQPPPHLGDGSSRSPASGLQFGQSRSAKATGI